MRDWTNLPLDLLVEIRRRLPIIEFITFRAVCVSWNDAVAESPQWIHPKPEMPWLMISGDTDTTAKFFSLSIRRVVSIPLPDPPICHRVVIGSDYGWLITIDEQWNVHLLNPISGTQIALPAIKTPQRHANEGFRSREIRWRFFYKAVLAAAPQPDSYTVMLLTGWEYGRRVSFVQSDFEEWMPLTELSDIVDIMLYKSRIYIAAFNGVVVAWEPSDRSIQRVLKFPGYLVGYPCINYMAESLTGSLIFVFKEIGTDKRAPVKFIVAVLNEEDKWVGTTDIGTAALFVGVNRPICVSVREYPELQANCVYFTNDDPLFFNRRQLNSNDFGVYDLKTGRLSKTRVPGNEQSRWPVVAWLTPSLT